MATSKSHHDVARQIMSQIRRGPIGHHWSDEDVERVSDTLKLSDIPDGSVDLRSHPLWTKLER